MSFVRILVLIVVALASGSIFAFAFAAACAMVAICLIALLTAYAFNPEDVKAIFKTFASKLDGWFTEFFKLMHIFTDVVRDAAQMAKAATEDARPKPSDSQEISKETKVETKATKSHKRSVNP